MPAKLSEQMENIHQFARQQLKMRSDSKKKNYGHRPLNHHRYDRGDASWLHNPQKKKGICPKLMHRFDGPFLVIRRMSDVLYRIQKCPKSKPNVVHHDRLKAYRGPNTPGWLAEGSVTCQVPPSPQSVAVESTTDRPGAVPNPALAAGRPRRAVRPPV